MTTDLPTPAIAPSLELALSHVTTSQNCWDTARRFANAANRFEHGAVACRVMAGIALLDLYQHHGISMGSRTDLADASSWPEIVKRELGVSDETARRWMAMAKSALPRLQSGEAGEVFRQLLTIPITELSEHQCKVLNHAVEKLVDGRSQLDFMASLGLMAPSGPRGGDQFWAQFLRENHPELIVDGKVPPRGKAGARSKEIREEFSKWMQARLKPSTPEQKRQAAQALLRQIDDVLMSAVNASVLGVLQPQDFAGTEAVTSMWVQRLKALS
ncbi:MAG: hypothetical protein KIT68_13615, partial [Phycisphaeraceae bacterium]|nr:hypothetical protein [Phycisphaeraceae bacterium]